MIVDSKRKSNTQKTTTKKNGKVLQVTAEKATSNVSVITKTTTPKVVIQSEKVKDAVFNQDYDKHLLLKLVCFVIMCAILLISFFLSLKTYNTVNELRDYIYQIFQI